MAMLGYATLNQTTQGLHQRLFARAFIIGQMQPQQNPSVVESIKSVNVKTVNSSSCDNSTHSVLRACNRMKETNYVPPQRKSSEKKSKLINMNPNTTICFVSVDIGLASDILNFHVLRRLNDLIQKQLDIDASENSSNSTDNETLVMQPPHRKFKYFSDAYTLCSRWIFSVFSISVS
jgi:Neutral/alkaline non-lysosomal ceramidase, N-terminal